MVSPSDRDVEAMVVALFTLMANVDRARRERKAASALTLLQVIAGGDAMRPSEIATRQRVHQSLVTRQIRELEDAGYVTVTANPEDGRSCLVALTPSGGDELARLTRIGLERFGLFVNDWKPDEVRTLAHLLEKLQASMTAVATRERPAASGRRWATRGGDARARRDRE